METIIHILDSYDEHDKDDEEKSRMEEHYIEEMLNASCAGNNSAVHRVGLCLKGLKQCPSKQHNHHNPEVHKIHMDICHEHFNKPCEEQMIKVEEAIWECSRNDTTSEDFRKCIPIPAQNHTEEAKKNDEKPKGEKMKKEGGKDEKKERQMRKR